MKRLSCLITISVLLSFFYFGESMTKSFAQDCDAGNPIALTFEYTGGGCEASDNAQDPTKWSCSDTSWPNPDPASITVSTTKEGYSITPNSVNLNEKFVVRKSGNPLVADSDFTLTSGTASEELTIHTSCSQPLVYGEDIFGSLTLVGYIGEDCINNLSATYASGGVQLTWDATGADHYNVYKSNISGGPYIFVGSTIDATFLDLTTLAGLNYVVRTAIFNSEEICQSNEVIALQAPGEQIDNIIEQFDDSVDAEEIVGDGPANSADGRLNAFGNMLDQAQDFIDAGNYTEACIILESAFGKCDGVVPPPDFVTGPAANAMAISIQTLMDTLGCE